MFFDLKNNRAIWQITMFSSLIVVVLSFQNCGSSKNFSADGTTENPSSCNPALQNCENTCEFDGHKIPDQGVVFAFATSTVAHGQTCTFEKRICQAGQLSGSFAYAQCEVGGPAACLFNGQTIAHGESVEAYVSSSVPFGSSCTKEVRTCNDGQLSGSYDYAKCDVGVAASCMFNGKTIAHNASVTAFASSTVPFGSSCASQARKCTNGVLSGSHPFASCNVGAAASCMFNDQTIAHGSTVTAYASSTVPFGSSCTSQTRTCNNGSLSGSHVFASCNVDQPAACMFNGKTVAHNASVTAFLAATVPFGSSCSSEARKCTNGTLAGSNKFSTCEVGQPASCTFNGKTVAHGSSVDAYQTPSVPAGQTCAKQARTCSNGSLSGSYGHGSCVAEGLVSTNVTVTIKCSISAAKSQTLKITMKDGSTKSWDFGSGEKTVTPFTHIFTSAPTKFEAFSGGTLSAHKYSNQTAKTINFSSEDGTDNDYNDLVCAFSW